MIGLLRSPPGTAGLGKETVLGLASHNPSHLYFTGRNEQAASNVIAEAKNRAPRCSITFIPCDLSSSRDQINQAIQSKFNSSRLDIFIANAGIMAVPPRLNKEGFEIQFATNYIGHAIMLSLLRPVMLQTTQMSGGSDVRFLSLTSWGHTMHPPGGIQFDKLKTPDAGTKWQRYGQSKLADIFLAQGMAKRYPQITSVAVHPGLVRTELNGGVERSLMTPFMKLLQYIPLIMLSPEKGSYNSLWCATTAKGDLENGGYYEPVGKKPPGKISTGTGMSELAKDERLADELWEWTENYLEGLEKL